MLYQAELHSVGGRYTGRPNCAQGSARCLLGLAAESDQDRSTNPREKSPMDRMRSVAVFCGSRRGINPLWAEAAEELGAGLARAKIRLV